MNIVDSVKIAFGTSEDFRKLQDAEPDSNNNSDSSKQDVENPEQWLSKITLYIYRPIFT